MENTISKSVPLTKQKLWDMAKVITEKQRTAKERTSDRIDWNLLEEIWFDWLEENLFGIEDLTQQKTPTLKT